MILLDDCKSSAQTPSSLFFENPLSHWRVFHIQNLEGTLKEMEAARADGCHVVGLFFYELGEALQGITRDSRRVSRARLVTEFQADNQRSNTVENDADADADAALKTPLLLEAFAFRQCKRLSNAQVIEWLEERRAAMTERDRTAGLLNAQASLNEDDYARDIAAIQAYIAKGDTYQVNHTFELRARAYGHPLALYQRLRERQPVRYGAYIETPDRHVLCFSPELFIKNEEGLLTAKPMKGTLSRLQAKATDLSNNEKDRAENLMITDLIRNDLGQICETGSIKVPALFDVEEVGDVYQMTSTITGRLKPDLSLHEILRASFPCGSVTGAPKKRTMEIIAELETQPRGLYCGSIGLFEPNGNFQLNVVIRTLEINAKRQVRVGIGSGITIDSQASKEWQECAVKAGFVTGLSSPVGLIETMRVENGQPPFLAVHLNRMQASAKALGVAFNRSDIEAQVQDYLRSSLQGEGVFRLRLELSARGELQISHGAIEPLIGSQTVYWAHDLLGHEAALMHSTNLLLAHKTTARAAYDAGWKAAVAKGGFDALFVNERGEVTEGGRSSLFICSNGQWWTPPLRSGVLPGVMREQLLNPRELASRAKDTALLNSDLACSILSGAQERVLYPNDIFKADALAVVNALRGVVPAKIL
ncbi:MAG: aminodeoxychorismate synthase component I [Burkholderiaceae bacterium]